MDCNDTGKIALEVTKAVIVGGISAVPVIGGVISELVGYLDSRHIEKRISDLEHAVLGMGISIQDFSDKLYRLESDEHRYYVVRNNLKYLCLSALPETVDALNRALIEIVMSEQPTMAEYACEIIRQLNADDILFLKLLKQYRAK
ncbi:MAG: hypothetical protein E7472_01025 [Ruminococcaceae bacterium]|nr:hypothetical protein [Oscillospiraceae bacterium]